MRTISIMVAAALLLLVFPTRSGGTEHSKVTVYLLAKNLLTRARLSVDDVRANASIVLTFSDKQLVKDFRDRTSSESCFAHSTNAVDVRAVVDIETAGRRIATYWADNSHLYGANRSDSVQLDACSADWLWNGTTYFPGK